MTSRNTVKALRSAFERLDAAATNIKSKSRDSEDEVKKQGWGNQAQTSNVPDDRLFNRNGSLISSQDLAAQKGSRMCNESTQTESQHRGAEGAIHIRQESLCDIAELLQINHYLPMLQQQHGICASLLLNHANCINIVQNLVPEMLQCLENSNVNPLQIQVMENRRIMLDACLRDIDAQIEANNKVIFGMQSRQTELYNNLSKFFLSIGQPLGSTVLHDPSPIVASIPGSQELLQAFESEMLEFMTVRHVVPSARATVQNSDHIKSDSTFNDDDNSEISDEVQALKLKNLKRVLEVVRKQIHRLITFQEMVSCDPEAAGSLEELSSEQYRLEYEVKIVAETLTMLGVPCTETGDFIKDPVYELFEHEVMNSLDIMSEVEVAEHCQDQPQRASDCEHCSSTNMVDELKYNDQDELEEDVDLYPEEVGEIFDRSVELSNLWLQSLPDNSIGHEHEIPPLQPPDRHFEGESEDNLKDVWCRSNTSSCFDDMGPDILTRARINAWNARRRRMYNALPHEAKLRSPEDTLGSDSSQQEY